MKKLNGHDIAPDAKCFNADGVDLNERELAHVREVAARYAKNYEKNGIDPNDVHMFVEMHASGFISGLDYPGREPTSPSDLRILAREMDDYVAQLAKLEGGS